MDTLAKAFVLLLVALMLPVSGLGFLCQFIRMMFLVGTEAFNRVAKWVMTWP
jgi:hypothetical protein